jgi:hypothetical protein
MENLYGGTQIWENGLLRTRRAKEWYGFTRLATVDAKVTLIDGYHSVPRKKFAQADQTEIGKVGRTARDIDLSVRRACPDSCCNRMPIASCHPQLTTTLAQTDSASTASQVSSGSGISSTTSDGPFVMLVFAADEGDDKTAVGDPLQNQVRRATATELADRRPGCSRRLLRIFFTPSAFKLSLGSTARIKRNLKII